MNRMYLFVLLVGCGGAEKPVAAPPPPLDAEPKTCPATPSAAAPRAKMMPVKLVEGRRTAGEPGIAPDDTTKMHMHEQGLAAVRADVLMCLDEAGTPTEVTMTSSSCLPAYDKRILAKVGEWRYKPFEIGGKASAVCTNVAFVYRQSPVPVAAP